VPTEELYRRDGEFIVCLSCATKTLQRECRHSRGCEAISALMFLSQRQRQVALKMAEGKSTKAIAYELGVTENTVESHRYQLYNRLGVHSIAQLVAELYRMGWVPEKPEGEVTH
jgi:DNA-binding NarL/FixJ family response regulator